MDPYVLHAPENTTEQLREHLLELLLRVPAVSFRRRVRATVVLVAFGGGLAVALIDAGFVYSLDALFVHSDNAQGGRGVEAHQAFLVGPNDHEACHAFFPTILNARGELANDRNGRAAFAVRKVCRLAL